MLSLLSLLLLSLATLVSLPSTSALPTVVQTPLDLSTLVAGCPTLKIRCVKDSDWPTGIVGDIGTKEFVWRAPRCQQKEPEKNTAECNETFEECEERCEAYAPIPF